jgi:GNAT superfamily N-acetyltransferase
MNIEQTKIRLAGPSDAGELAKLAEKTFRDAFAELTKREDLESYVAGSFNTHQIRSELGDSANVFFIAMVEGRWVGYAKLYCSPSPGCVKLLPTIELSRLYSMQQYLGCGIGPALLKTCVSHARSQSFKSIWLSSWKKNHRGNAFYAKMQFEIVGTKSFALGSDIQEDYVFVKSLV